MTTPVIPSCFMAFSSDPYFPFEIFNFYYTSYSYHNILTKMLNSNMQYRSNYQWKGLYRLLLWRLYMLYHSACFSPPVLHMPGWLLLERLPKRRSIWEGRVSFHFITCGNIHLLLWKSYKLYPTVPLFVATFRIHADDDNNPIFPYPLYTANSLVHVVIIICNLQLFK